MRMFFAFLIGSLLGFGAAYIFEWPWFGWLPGIVLALCALLVPAMSSGVDRQGLGPWGDGSGGT